MLLWFVLTFVSVLFVAVDIRSTPESPVLKWGFVLLTAYTGPVGAFLYVLGCREPLPGLHERYVATTWRQVLGSTMHCVAGDGVGILAGAMLGSILSISQLSDLALEYLLGFTFGWTIFQALFMRNMAEGSYWRALTGTFVPEFLSMNFLMAGMVPVVAIGRATTEAALHPLMPEFWFVMSMALLTGFIVAYPINWWLVTNGLKHGMMTVRRSGADTSQYTLAETGPSSTAHAHRHGGAAHASHSGDSSQPSNPVIVAMGVLSVAVFAIAVWGETVLAGF